MNPMHLNPLWAPARRLPRVPRTPPPAYTEHGVGNVSESLPRRVYSRMLPFRNRVNTDSFAVNDFGYEERYDPETQPIQNSRRHSISEHIGSQHSSGGSSDALGSVALSNPPLRARGRSSQSRPASNYHYRRRARSTSVPSDRATVAATPQCDVGDCTRPPTPGTSYCRAHICDTDSCPQIRSLGSRYCATHGCRLCEKRVSDPGARFCVGHKCIVASCDRCKGDGNLYWCKRHACRFGDKDGEMGIEIDTDAKGKARGREKGRRDRETECAKPCVADARYCIDHVCAMSGCYSKVLRNAETGELGNYCCCHTCEVDTCLRRPSRAAFCAAHECAMAGCPNPRVWSEKRRGGNSGTARERKHECCRYHTCVQSECFAPTVRVGGLCDFHAQRDDGHGEREERRKSSKGSSSSRYVETGRCDEGYDYCSTRHRCCRARERERHHRHSDRRKSRGCRKDDSSAGSEQYRSLTIRIVRLTK
ncbi:hypothetical protein F5Y16DRAFT_78959 [Xylariaceae sp. FL0255]|nr:hypothetical protein F5Y16DRAFT_78959 [Xylariaceae sp. FL0255]